MSNFLEHLTKFKNNVSKDEILQEMKSDGVYRGRSNKGSSNTIGVRLSQFKFYMFGYFRNPKVFIPSPITRRLVDSNIDFSDAGLVSLISLQFPHPYSKTPNDFRIHFGRLILKLLLDKELENRLYYDEVIWFLPFIKDITPKSYVELVISIKDYRRKSFDEKKTMFESIDNYNSVFANITHEYLYYFKSIYTNYMDILESHKLPISNTHVFIHGKKTKRMCRQGYISINNKSIEKTQRLLEHLTPFDDVLSLDNPLIFSQKDLLNDLYEITQINALSYLSSTYDSYNEALKAVSKMVYSSKYGSKDGKEFESSLKPILELFREIRNVEIHSGPGKTDLLCAVYNPEKDSIFKINVDAKTSSNTVSSLNPRRLLDHIMLNGSDYCIVVSPKFSKGAKLDIASIPVVTIEAESIANYLINEITEKQNNTADFKQLDQIIRQNLGKDISNIVFDLVENNIGYFDF
jgi:hypothetical protein